MSEPATPNPAPEPASPNPDSAFGASFEAALAAAFAESGSKLEPSTPQPDALAEPAKAEPVKAEPAKAEPVKPDKPKLPDTVDDLLFEPEEKDVKLPIDEDPEDPADTADMAEAAASRFRKLRSEKKEIAVRLNTLARDLAQREARIAELEAVSGQSEEVTRRLAEYELQLSVTKLEATDAYRTAVTVPLGAIADSAAAIAAKHEIPESALLDAIGESDPAKQDSLLEDLLAGVPDRDRMKIYALAEQLPAIVEQREKLRSNSSAALAELEARREAEKAAETLENSKTRRAAAELVNTRVLAKIPFLSDETKFDTASVLTSVADTDFDALDVTTKAYNTYAGKLVPRMAAAYNALLAELETATGELDGYRKASPKPAGPAGASEVPSELSFRDAIERHFTGR